MSTAGDLIVAAVAGALFGAAVMMLVALAARPGGRRNARSEWRVRVIGTDGRDPKGVVEVRRGDARYNGEIAWREEFDPCDDEERGAVLAHAEEALAGLRHVEAEARKSLRSPR